MSKALLLVLTLTAVVIDVRILGVMLERLVKAEHRLFEVVLVQVNVGHLEPGVDGLGVELKGFGKLLLGTDWVLNEVPIHSRLE